MNSCRQCGIVQLIDCLTNILDGNSSSQDLFMEL